jgi:large subunit ribosomal protein L34e
MELTTAQGPTRGRQKNGGEVDEEATTNTSASNKDVLATTQSHIHIYYPATNHLVISGPILSWRNHRLFPRLRREYSIAHLGRHIADSMVVLVELFLFRNRIHPRLRVSRSELIKMPTPHQRTRSKRRVRRTVPGGRIRTLYKAKARTSFCCRLCGQPLAGISNTNPSDAHKLNRTRRRINRPYGGQLCHKCLRSILGRTARISQT